MDVFADYRQIAAITVSGLTDYLQVLVEEDSVLRRIWVLGEVSSARRHASGVFFTLKDPEGNETVNCVIWRSQLSRITDIPEVGEQVVVLGTARLYPQRSNYQLMVWQVLPSGDGLQALRLQQLRSRLQAEGLFDPEAKQPLPPYPETLGVVTSAQAAAWGDIQRTLKNHHPGLQVLLSPATVQGDLAPRSIQRAIERVVADGRAQVLILARGGGAEADLDCFNDERVVRAVATCPIPVVTGIGHERDESLADLAADVRAHTPTAAAVVAVPALVDMEQDHCDRISQVLGSAEARLGIAEQQIAHLEQRLRQLPLERHLQSQTNHLQQLQRRLLRSVQVELRQQTQRCSALGEQLASLDPEAVLNRGYALVRHQRQLISRSRDVEIGDQLEIQLAQGRITAEVKDIPTEVE